MGVPVLSLAGEHHAGRVGATLLNAVGLSDWLASTPEAFVSLARARAADAAGLARLRGALRGQIAATSLCDAATFVRRLEAAMQQAWVRQLEDVPSKA